MISRSFFYSVVKSDVIGFEIFSIVFENFLFYYRNKLPIFLLQDIRSVLRLNNKNGVNSDKLFGISSRFLFHSSQYREKNP